MGRPRIRPRSRVSIFLEQPLVLKMKLRAKREGSNASQWITKTLTEVLTRKKETNGRQSPRS